MSRVRTSRSLYVWSLCAALAVASGAAVAQSPTTVSPPSAPSTRSLQAPDVATPTNRPVPPMPIPNVGGPTIIAPDGDLTPPPVKSPLVLPQSPASPLPRVRPGETALSLSARFGPSAPAISNGLHWRVYADRPDAAGVFQLVKEDRTAHPTLALPSGGYVVHVAFGLASAVKPVKLNGEPFDAVFEIPAGGLTLKGQVGDVRIPPAQISFDIFMGSQFEQGDKRPIAANVLTGSVVLVPEGTYYIVSKYGDGNSVVRSDIRVQAGKLTDVTITHRAAIIMLRLVSKPGGEALANTEWAVVSPAGDTITESKGAFPRVILAEGEYKVIARNDNHTYQQDLKVITGVDSEVEVLAR